MVALYRSGRQGDALQAYADARRTLVDELGLEPGPRCASSSGRSSRRTPVSTRLVRPRRLPAPPRPPALAGGGDVAR